MELDQFRRLSPEGIKRWRLLSGIPGWEVIQIEGEGVSLFPKNDVHLFHVPIIDGFFSPKMCITKVQHKNFTLKKGRMIAGANYLLFIDHKSGDANPLPYEAVKSVRANKGEFTLSLQDGSELKISTKYPQASLAGAIAGLTSSSIADTLLITRMQEQSNAAGSGFLSLFHAFLQDIAEV